jgi:uncharacterized protein (TIGR02453 family)
MMNAFDGFPPEALKFLRQLKRNNNRDWFLAHKEAYELKVKAPMTDLVLALGHALHRPAQELVIDPKRAIYRIHRDVRFSADKSPYKTHVAAIFAPRGIPKHSGACLYFHIEPSEVVVAGGVYMPDPATLKALRRHIAENWDALQSITRNRSFRKLFGDLQGDRLVRPPSGFAADHPAIDVLRQKQFYVSTTEPPQLAETPKLYSRLLQLFLAMMPLVRYLNAPLQSTDTRVFDKAFGLPGDSW